MSLKLLFVNSSLTDGGSEKAMTLVAQALAARGHEVTMTLVREKERTYALCSQIRLLQLRFHSRKKVFKLLDRMRQLRRIISRGHYDYVICYMWDLNLMTLLAAVGLRRRIIVSERANPGVTGRSKLSRLAERALYRLAYKVVYQTDEAREFCPRELLDKSVVVPNMVEPHKGELVGLERSKRIVSVGRLLPQKNFPLLLKSFAYFLEHNRDWTLEIYGKGPLELELKRFAESLGISGSVTFAGYVPDVATQIRNAGMFVLSSDYEGISNAMAEAMSLGIPSVCTDCPVGGAALMINHGVSGLLVPVRDEPALTSAMNRIANDEAFAARISAGAIESTNRFAPEEVALLWEKCVLR